MRIVQTLLLTTIKSAESIAGPIINRVIECMTFSTENLMSCASNLELACTNTFAKKCDNHAHQKLGVKERQQRKEEQLLIKGIAEASKERALCRALEDAKATFLHLASAPSQSPDNPKW